MLFHSFGFAASQSQLRETGKMLPKFAPRCGERAILKSKSLKHQVLGAFFEVQSASCVTGAGISTKHPCKKSVKRIETQRSSV